MSTAAIPPGASPFRRTTQVLIVGSVLLTFISYWRTAAIVLCDMASTAYYVGGIAEQAIGKAAPWFIVAVLLFAYLVSRVYLESCGLFVRGGVYRVVKEAMGGFLAKLAVSALMFDYILTGPISSVAAGQYIMGLLLDLFALIGKSWEVTPAHRSTITGWGAVLIAIAITLYFYRRNLIGLHESSEKALKIMIATAIMGAIMIAWCGVTLAVRGPTNADITAVPDLSVKSGHGGHEMDPLGFIGRFAPDAAARLREPGNWLSLIGLIGILIAFGHSILAMSGLETLAQVYREVESPKMKNFKKAALIVILFSLILTGTTAFMAVMIIPNDQRMPIYKDNLIGGLAMNVIGPVWARWLLNAFVTVVGFLILSGAVNTAIIGSNGVLNRVAEDGVIPSTLQKPHPRYGTTYRLLRVIVGLQLVTIVASGGDTILLGEAYAFGVVWSFTFKSMSMVVLRFTDKSPREYKVPGNVRIGGVELPLGLAAIFLMLLTTAVLNVLTKEVATVSGILFTLAFLGVFMITEYVHERGRKGAGHHVHVEQFSRTTPEAFTPEALQLDKPYRKLVAIRSTQNLHMLEKALEETDPDTTDVVVMTAKDSPMGEGRTVPDLDPYDQNLMTAVVGRAEKAGKEVVPLIVPTNNPLFAINTVARALGAQELILGASNKFTAEEQLDQIALYWMNLPGPAQPITIRILGRNWDTHIDLEGGARIPTLRERRARSVDDLREAGIGVRRALFVHNGTQDGSDLFDAVLTMLDTDIKLGVVSSAGPEPEVNPEIDVTRARELEREVTFHVGVGHAATDLIHLVREHHYDLLFLARTADEPVDRVSAHVEYLFRHAPCRVGVIAPPVIPRKVEPDAPPPPLPPET